jgi:hypothetical protein
MGNKKKVNQESLVKNKGIITEKEIIPYSLRLIQNGVS